MKKRIGRYIALFSVVLMLTLILGGVGLFGMHVAKIRLGMQREQENLISSEQLGIEGEVPLSDELFSEEIGETDTSRYGYLLDDPDYMAAENIYAKTAASAEEITLVFGGDILFDDSYSVMSTLKSRGGSVEAAFDEALLQYMRTADICMLNNEFTYTTRGTATSGKQYTFRSNPENVFLLNDMGVDLVSLANNHAYDYGEESIIDTMETLKNAGIPYVGAGHNKEEAIKPVYFLINDMKIAVVAASQIEQLDHPDTKPATDTSAGVFRCWNDDTVLDVLREAKANSDFVVFYVHWGMESTTTLHWGQTDYVESYVEAGADLIIGDHPHVLQEIGMVEGVPVIYSVGNFWFNSKERDTCLIEVKVNEGGIKSFRFVPCIQSDCRTAFLEGDEKNRLIQYMNSISSSAWLDEEGYLDLH